MIGFFCKTTAKNDEEYIKDIKKKMKLFVLVGIVGIATMVITELAVNQGGIKLNSRIHGFYPILIKFVVPAIFLFLISYGIFCKIYEKRI